jgi:hypothetical protein
MSCRVLKNAVVWTPEEIRKRWLGRCLFGCLMCAQQNFIYVMNMRVKVSFLHDNQVPHPKYQWFCAVISVRLRKTRANEVPLCFRCAVSLCTHPHMYLQRSATSRIHWQLHVKGAVSCPPWTVQPWRKSLRKSFVIHLFERSTVWCSLLVLKMSSSAAAHGHKSWPSWLWRKKTWERDTTPLLRPIFRDHTSQHYSMYLFRLNRGLNRTRGVGKLAIARLELRRECVYYESMKRKLI